MSEQNKESAPRVAIIVLNYRGRECLPRCLRSLEKLAYSNREIIVVDNASQDGSLESAEAEFFGTVFLRLPENRGFAAGMNHGMRAALDRGADYVWLFNNDAQAERESLDRLIRVAESKPAGGLFSPIILTERGHVWFASARVNFWRMRTEHMLPPGRAGEQECYESKILTGCALLIKKATVESIGFLDERFFLYYEDAEYSVRARACGLKTIVVPGARVRHSEESNKNTLKTYHLVLSGLLFFGQQAHWAERLYLVPYVTIRRIKNALEGLLGRSQAQPVARAYKEYFHDHTALLLPRHRKFPQRFPSGGGVG